MMVTALDRKYLGILYERSRTSFYYSFPFSDSQSREQSFLVIPLFCEPDIFCHGVFPSLVSSLTEQYFRIKSNPRFWNKFRMTPTMSYDNFAHTFSNSRKLHPWPELDYIIEDIKVRGYQSILDIGCGNGRFLEETKDTGLKIKDYLGVDNSRGMIEEARKLHPEYRFEVMDMTQMLNVECWMLNVNAIILLASFHHLKTRDERKKVLENIRSLIAPGGRLYMTNWNLRDQEKYEKSHRWNGDYNIKIWAYSRYYHGFTLDELETLFSETWWDIVSSRIFEGWRNFLSILS